MHQCGEGRSSLFLEAFVYFVFDIFLGKVFCLYLYIHLFLQVSFNIWQSKLKGINYFCPFVTRQRQMPGQRHIRRQKLRIIIDAPWQLHFAQLAVRYREREREGDRQLHLCFFYKMKIYFFFYNDLLSICWLSGPA